MAILSPNLRALASKSSSLIAAAWIRSLPKHIHVTSTRCTSFNSFCNVGQPRSSSSFIFQGSFTANDSDGVLPIVGFEAPNFKAEAIVPNKGKDNVQLSDYLAQKRYVILYFYPRDFDKYTAKELQEFSVQYQEFQKKRTDILGISVNDIDTHVQWIDMDHGLGPLKYSLVSDSKNDKYISRAYNVYVPKEGMSLRAIFIIDKEGVIQHSEINNLDIAGNNNFYTPELRVLETLKKLQAIRYKKNESDDESDEED